MAYPARCPVIEPTDEMIAAFDRAVDEQLGYLHRPQAEVLRVGLAAVLAVVERDQPTAKAGPGEDPCGKAHPDRPYTCQRRARHDVCVSWQSGAGADAWVVDYDDLVRQIEDLRAVLDKLLDPHACHYDHHGDCQEHGTGAERPCPHSRAKELLGWSAP